MSVTTILAADHRTSVSLDTVDAVRIGDGNLVEIRPEAVQGDPAVVTLVLRSLPGTPAGERLIEDLDLNSASAARLVGLLVDALDRVDPVMAAAARTLAGAR